MLLGTSLFLRSRALRLPRRGLWCSEVLLRRRTCESLGRRRWRRWDGLLLGGRLCLCRRSLPRLVLLGPTACGHRRPSRRAACLHRVGCQDVFRMPGRDCVFGWCVIVFRDCAVCDCLDVIVVQELASLVEFLVSGWAGVCLFCCKGLQFYGRYQGLGVGFDFLSFSFSFETKTKTAQSKAGKLENRLRTRGRSFYVTSV